MRTRPSLAVLALLALAQSVFVVPASAETAATPAPSHVAQPSVAPLEACLEPAEGARLAQVAGTECCKDQKGICGCRAGKIVCCDSKPSTHPGCTCHGDNGFIE